MPLSAKLRKERAERKRAALISDVTFSVESINREHKKLAETINNLGNAVLFLLEEVKNVKR